MAPLPVRIAAYPLTIENRYESLLAALQAQVPDAQRLVILGESFGGPLAIRLAEALGTRAERLILCATFARAFFRSINGLRHMLPWSALPKLLTLPGARTLAHQVVDPGFLQALSEVPVKRLRERLDAAATVDARSALARVHVPIDYVQAVPDWLVPPSCLSEITAIAPATRVHRLAGTHFLLQQRASAVAALIHQITADSA